jgi:hypothetical protein
LIPAIQPVLSDSGIGSTFLGFSASPFDFFFGSKSLASTGGIELDGSPNSDSSINVFIVFSVATRPLDRIFRVRVDEESRSCKLSELAADWGLAEVFCLFFKVSN